MRRRFSKVVAAFDYVGSEARLRKAVEGAAIKTAIDAETNKVDRRGGPAYARRHKLHRVSGTGRWEYYPKIGHDEQKRTFKAGDDAALAAWERATERVIRQELPRIAGVSNLTIHVSR